MATHRFQAVLQAENGGVFFAVPLDVPTVEMLRDGRRRPLGPDGLGLGRDLA